MNAQERLAYLSEIIETPTNHLVTLSDIEKAVGEDAYQLVRLTLDYASNHPFDESDAAKLESINLADAISAMSSTGLSLSPANRQAVIDRLAMNQVMPWPTEVRDAIKSLGVMRRPRWKDEGYAAEPTLEQITNDLRKSSALDAAKDRLQAYEEAWCVWDGSPEGEPTL